jgi:hypothetical protein
MLREADAAVAVTSDGELFPGSLFIEYSLDSAESLNLRCAMNGE